MLKLVTAATVLVSSPGFPVEATFESQHKPAIE